MASRRETPPCVISTHQCWLERLALVRRTSRSKPPSAIGAQKFTVNDSGSPARCGWSISARRMVAAVQPPNGPTKAQ
jgi:hypothetical protein